MSFLEVLLTAAIAVAVFALGFICGAGRRERQPRAPSMEEMGLRRTYGDDSEDARIAEMRAAKGR
jgi:hypothetical protein